MRYFWLLDPESSSGRREGVQEDGVGSGRREGDPESSSGRREGDPDLRQEDSSGGGDVRTTAHEACHCGAGRNLVGRTLIFASAARRGDPRSRIEALVPEFFYSVNAKQLDGPLI